MKKLLIVLSIAFFGFAACNGSAEKSTTTDSTIVTVDTQAIAPISHDTFPAAPKDSLIVVPNDSGLVK